MPVEIATGQRIGPYELDVHLGGGGFGSVWRATHVDTGQTVAIKLLNADPGVNARAEIELLAATASSSSVHVVRVLTGGTEPVPYIVMEYIDGPDYAELLTERGRLPIDEVLRVGLALTDALAALHQVGIIHRDVKPANVMVDRDGTIKLTDFGIAKISGVATATTTRQAPITMAYAAPEVWDGHATRESDLYALGILLYQCLVGQLPFVAGIGQLYVMHRSHVPDFAAMPPETPASLGEAVRQCLAKVPSDRPRDAAACTALLERAQVELADASATARTSAEPARFGPWVRQRPHETQPWAWHCQHESSAESAIIEVHGFESWERGEQQMRRAYEVNPQLVPFGAERVLGWNRMLLRPEESWASTPPGAILYWIARAGEGERESASVVTTEQMRSATSVLVQLTAAAAAAGLDLTFTAESLWVDVDGALHVLRPGLGSMHGRGGDISPLGALLALPLDDETRRLVAGAVDLRSLEQSLGGDGASGTPPAFGVALSPERAGAADVAGNETTVTVARHRVSLDEQPPAEAVPATPHRSPASPRSAPLPDVTASAGHRLSRRKLLAMAAAPVAVLAFTAVAFAAARPMMSVQRELSSGTSSAGMLDGASEGQLFTFNDNEGNPQPGLASSWEVVSPNKVIFTLRRNPSLVAGAYDYAPAFVAMINEHTTELAGVQQAAVIDQQRFSISVDPSVLSSSARTTELYRSLAKLSVTATTARATTSSPVPASTPGAPLARSAPSVMPATPTPTTQARVQTDADAAARARAQADADAAARARAQADADAAARARAQADADAAARAKVKADADAAAARARAQADADAAAARARAQADADAAAARVRAQADADAAAARARAQADADAAARARAQADADAAAARAAADAAARAARPRVDCASLPWSGVYPPYEPSFAPGQTVSWGGNNFRSNLDGNRKSWIFQGNDACRAANG